ncbi:MAG: formylglycine-generating enzyme family protein [Balneolaceae bacterium]|nr:formylglycine-generating enzyme family protein [Balneolaceae bacterium]MBO6546893.1 formylglycine-generating enzyme family protein [Balneolaceae bacterium]MBO6649253.1 formylglycine-generating enzyme family protein [Balneolaceae bacterium]
MKYLLFLSVTFWMACTIQKVDELEGMIYFEGGEITIGSEHGMPNETPSFKTKVPPFFIDKSPVTVAEFRKFVQATGYVTEAEKFGDSGVLDFATGRWVLEKGANWKHPHGENEDSSGDDHPVTQVSWNDANAYAKWAGKRLPTEIEWEYAAKGGKDSGNKYSWGDQLKTAGMFKANTWQGDFPVENTNEDNFLYTSPVGEFGETQAGLTDMGGNVWEWTSDTYKPYEGNPAFYMFSIDSAQKVIRGGSFLCHEDYCHGYRVSARQFNSKESATFNMGFRTVKDVQY